MTLNGTTGFYRAHKGCEERPMFGMERSSLGNYQATAGTFNRLTM
jgi:hypothetical protein